MVSALNSIFDGHPLRTIMQSLQQLQGHTFGGWIIRHPHCLADPNSSIPMCHYINSMNGPFLC